MKVVRFAWGLQEVVFVTKHVPALLGEPAKGVEVLFPLNLFQ